MGLKNDLKVSYIITIREYQGGWYENF